MKNILFSIITDYQIIVTVLVVIIAWRFGDWRNWQLYYPTMLYYVVGDISCSFVFYNFPLWELESPLLKTTFSDLLISMVAFPAAILVYLPYFPKTLFKRAMYILAWAIIFGTIEFISFKLGFISYFHGWCLMWTFAFDIIMFTLLALHFKKPLLTLGLSAICAIIVMLYFQVPISSMK